VATDIDMFSSQLPRSVVINV